MSSLLHKHVTRVWRSTQGGRKEALVWQNAARSLCRNEARGREGKPRAHVLALKRTHWYRKPCTSSCQHAEPCGTDGVCDTPGGINERMYSVFCRSAHDTLHRRGDAKGAYGTCARPPYPQYITAPGAPTSAHPKLLNTIPVCVCAGVCVCASPVATFPTSPQAGELLPLRRLQLRNARYSRGHRAQRYGF